MAIEILDYDLYIPSLRITDKEYRKGLGQYKARGIKRKAVMEIDEDPLTMAVEAGMRLLRNSTVASSAIDTLVLASTTMPYGEKSNAVTVATALGLKEDLFIGELSSSARGGSEGLLYTANSLVQNRSFSYGLLIAADAPASGIYHQLEHGAGAAAAAVLMGQNGGYLELEDKASFYQELLGVRFKTNNNSHLADLGLNNLREQNLYLIMNRVVSNLLARLSRKAEDYRYVVFPQFDGLLPYRIGRKLGFTDDQIRGGTVAGDLGDVGSASSLIGLIALLKGLDVDDKVLLTSYGSGSIGEAISFRTCRRPEKVIDITGIIDQGREITFVDYLKLRSY